MGHSFDAGGQRHGPTNAAPISPALRHHGSHFGNRMKLGESLALDNSE